MRYGLNLIQNFTYFLANPVDGDQFEQEDRRTAVGAKVSYRRLGRFLGRPVESLAGVQLRHDNAGTIGLYDTVGQRRTNTIRDDILKQTSGGLFAQSEIEWSPVFRTTLGLRGDLYGYEITALDPRNSGDGSDGIVSPKLTVVLGPWQDTEFYVNWGHGFHSNDVRGATLTVDPRTGLPVETLTPLVTARGAGGGHADGEDSRPAVDAGALVPRLRFGAAVHRRLRHHRGEPAEPALRPRVGQLHALHVLDDRRGRHVVHECPVHGCGRSRSVHSRRAQPGCCGRRDGRAGEADLREPARAPFRPRALVEDNSVHSESTTIWNAELGITLNEQMRVSIEGFNLFNSDVADIDYFYASRLPGEPIDGVEGIHTHPSIPRTARVSLQVAF